LIVGAAKHLCDYATHRRASTDALKGALRESALALEGIVSCGRTDKGTKKDEFIRDRGNAGHQFSKLQSGKIRTDRSERTSLFRRRVGLGIDEIHLGGPTIEMDIDDCLLTGPSGRGAFSTEKIR
jgi:hypothetical protein